MSAREGGALAEAIVFLNYFKDRPDDGQRRNVTHSP
jgi:hypothetical protein